MVLRSSAVFSALLRPPILPCRSLCSSRAFVDANRFFFYESQSLAFEGSAPVGLKIYEYTDARENKVHLLNIEMSWGELCFPPLDSRMPKLFA